MRARRKRIGYTPLRILRGMMTRANNFTPTKDCAMFCGDISHKTVAFYRGNTVLIGIHVGNVPVESAPCIVDFPDTIFNRAIIMRDEDKTREQLICEATSLCLKIPALGQMKYRQSFSMTIWNPEAFKNAGSFVHYFSYIPVSIVSSG